MVKLMFDYGQFSSVVNKDRSFFNDKEISKLLDLGIQLMAARDFKKSPQEVMVASGCGESLKDLIITKNLMGELPRPAQEYWTLFNEALLGYRLDATHYIHMYNSCGYRAVGADRTLAYGVVHFEPY